MLDVLQLSCWCSGCVLLRWRASLLMMWWSTSVALIRTCPGQVKKREALQCSSLAGRYAPLHALLTFFRSTFIAVMCNDGTCLHFLGARWGTERLLMCGLLDTCLVSWMCKDQRVAVLCPLCVLKHCLQSAYETAHTVVSSVSRSVQVHNVLHSVTVLLVHDNCTVLLCYQCIMCYIVNWKHCTRAQPKHAQWLLQDIFRMNQKQLEIAVRRMWSDSGTTWHMCMALYICNTQIKHTHHNRTCCCYILWI